MQSLLNFQRREETSKEAKTTLSLVLRRLSSFTAVYARFPTTAPEIRMVSMRPYLQ